jgi:hypothetical protein
MKGEYWLLLGVAGFFVMTGVGSTGYTGAVVLLSQAIASAEGFYVGGSIPANNNNPGNLTQDVNNTAVGTDSNGFMIYASSQDGWNALYYQVNLILTNASHVYNNAMTLLQIGNLYSPGTGSTWAANVASYLGVTPNTPVSQIL